MKLERLSDEELAARARAACGSAEGVRCANALFRQHYARVARWCFRFTGERESAADLAQEIFAKAFRHLGSFQGHSKFSTWLYSIVKNQCVNAIRARSNRQADAELVIELPVEDDDDSILFEEGESSADLALHLLNAALDETEKAVFTLHYADDLPLDAITRLLGLKNPSGAKAYIVSAKRKLSRSIRRWKARQQRTLG